MGHRTIAWASLLTTDRLDIMQTAEPGAPRPQKPTQSSWPSGMTRPVGESRLPGFHEQTWEFTHPRGSFGASTETE